MEILRSKRCDLTFFPLPFFWWQIYEANSEIKFLSNMPLYGKNFSSQSNFLSFFIFIIFYPSVRYFCINFLKKIFFLKSHFFLMLEKVWKTWITIFFARVSVINFSILWTANQGKNTQLWIFPETIGELILSTLCKFHKKKFLPQVFHIIKILN